MARRDTRIDILLVVISIVVLISSVWIWIVALPIAREIVFLATTIALVISLILVVNVVVLILLRFQRRITDLEAALSGSQTEPETESSEDRVIVVTLTKIERRVINRLEENGGEMLQDELRRATGLSKSTLSTTLSTLERKALVAREVSGRTKLVVLKQKVTR